MHNIYTGPQALKNFLDPTTSPPTPIVELPRQLNPLYDKKVRIFAKLMNMLPLGNIKSVPAHNMLKEAKAKGDLTNVHTVVENSSGNTVYSLTVLARLMGIPKTLAYVSHEVSPGKLNLLRIFGANPIVNEEPICPKYDDKSSGIHVAKQLGKEEGYYNPSQYDNQKNPEGHQHATAKHIYEQMQGNIQVFCAGLGTTGTIVGCSTFLKEKNPNLHVVGVIRAKNNPIPGVRTEGLLEMTGLDWKKHTDATIEVGTRESYKQSLDMIRNGLVVGPSSGFNLLGLIEHMQSLESLDHLRNDNGEINAVFICCDTPYPYIDEYFAYLDASHFPQIENEHLLANTLVSPSLAHTKEISPKDAYDKVYGISTETLWKYIEKREPVQPKMTILDVRAHEEFEHYHLPGSMNISHDIILHNIEAKASTFANRQVLVVCAHGVRSQVVSDRLNALGIDAYSLEGGLTEWSKLNLPRWKPDTCLKN